MLDSFAHFCLKFGHITVIFPMVVLGMIFHRRDLYAKAASFLLWVMIFNTLLKYLFKVPLFPHLGNGYAFPSGHMHAAAAFYGYIIYKTNNRIVKIALGILLFCLGFSLIYCHFHDLMDVAGAFGFAMAELAVYHYVYKNWGDKVTGIASIVSAIAIIYALAQIYKVEFHVWLAFYGLVGMELVLTITDDIRLNSIFEKITATAIVVLLVMGVYYLFRFFAFSEFYLSEIRFALAPFVIVGAMQISKRLQWRT